MNQILITYDYNKNIIKNKKNIYFFLFLFFLLLIIIIFSFIFYNRYNIYKKSSNSNNALNIYKISTLYTNKSNYTALELSNEISIIGLIDIPSIAISYPILSKSTDELLKICPCRFSGPLPNNYGNLCIAGHNYKNTLMFSNLNKLEKGDSIFITDLNKNKLEYLVYKKYVSDENDLNCIKSESDIEVTLITCNSFDNTKRLILKAKMKEL